MDPPRHQGVQGIIYEAMAGHPGQAFEAQAGDAHGEVASFPGSGMAGVEMADYAVANASTDQVRRLAESISIAQQSELTVLDDLLDERGGPVTLS